MKVRAETPKFFFKIAGLACISGKSLSHRQAQNQTGDKNYSLTAHQPSASLLMLNHRWPLS